MTGMDDIVVAVLVVDDQPGFRKAAAAVVAACDGFILAGEADSGESAVAFVRAARPTMVLMDINMPGMGGIEATRRIHAERPDLMILLMSTYDPSELPADITECGAVGYLHKELLEPMTLARAWQHA